MTIALYFAAFLAFSVGVAHSVLGEKYILIRLFRRDNLPKLFGSDLFVRRTLRFAWHLTTLAWWGFAALFVLLATENSTPQMLGYTLAATFFASALVCGGYSRGRHLAWIVFLLIGLIALAFALGT